MRRVKLVLATVAMMAMLLTMVTAPAMADQTVCFDVLDGSRCADLGCEFVGFDRDGLTLLFLCEIDLG